MSFVLVSPSTESWSQVRAALARSIAWSAAGSAVASVSTIESIVAMRGWIIPTPFAMPVTVTGTVPPPGAGRSTVAVATFVTGRWSAARSPPLRAPHPGGEPLGDERGDRRPGRHRAAGGSR